MDWEKDSDTANAVAGSVPRDCGSVALCHTDCALIFPFVICEKEYLSPAWEKGLCSFGFLFCLKWFSEGSSLFIKQVEVFNGS